MLRNSTACLALCALKLAAQTPFVPPGTRSTFDGVYSAAQAARGEQAYTAHCARCHRADMSAYGGVLIGAYFLEGWRDEPLTRVYSLMRRTMPRGAAGTLSEAQYLDILAYVLKTNHFVPGEIELRSDDLDHIWVADKNGLGAILPFGSLVEMVGCVAQAEDSQWVIKDATGAVRTRNPDASQESDRNAAAAQPAGHFLYRLRGANSWHLEKQSGRRVQLKGFLTRSPEGGLVDPTSIEPAGGECRP